MYEKQQIVMSEAVMEGKGDKDDSDINLPADLNDSSMSSSIVSPDNNPTQEKQPSIQEHVLKHCKSLAAIFTDFFFKKSDRIKWLVSFKKILPFFDKPDAVALTFGCKPGIIQLFFI